MENQHLALCQGYASSDGSVRIEPHQYARDRPALCEGSHGICPNCLELYKKDVAIMKAKMQGLESKVQ